MAKYTYICPDCQEETLLVRPMKDGPDKTVACACGGTAVRRYAVAPRITFSPFEIQTDWMIENYNRYRARHKGKHAPRFSPNKIKRPDPVPRFVNSKGLRR
jgi:putative FmdB family regulatory protein